MGPNRSPRSSWPATPAPRVLVVAATVAVAILVGACARGGGGDRFTGSGPPEGERPVGFRSADGTRLAGTLADPAGEPKAGVLILGDFGAASRDGVSVSGRAYPLYRDLADTLRASGIASLRFDKRGTGESAAGDRDPTLDDLVADASAALDLLAEHLGAGAGRLGVVGHGEGAVVSLRVAAETPLVGAVALVSAPGQPLVEGLEAELGATVRDPERARLATRDLRRLVASLLDDGSVPSDLAPEVLSIAVAGPPGYLATVLTADPRAAARRVDAPVLLVWGGADARVGTADADALASGLAGPHERLYRPRANHELHVFGPAKEQYDEHGDRVATTGSPDGDALESIATWLAARLAPS